MPDSSTPDRSVPEGALLEARNLGKRVSAPDGDLILLQDIDLRLAAGASLAITGPSGSGKSTLLGLLAGLDTPSSGEVWLGGQPFSALTEDARARRRGELCAFVFQDFHLVGDLTALENVMLPLELQRAPDAAQRARAWLDRVGLGHRIGHFPATLSGGEQQRAALARAFAVAPQLLFADEPTGSLDHVNSARVQDLLFELNRETGAALVLVTHDAPLAERCGRHLRLEEGRIRALPEPVRRPHP
ncbi:MAG: ATP-binding cassette domain-containing protein [Porticoccaceae bacterium]|nr:MAG: ATP-binding cassette domain-containing protein [Porticoccaceae bacterium]